VRSIALSQAYSREGLGDVVPFDAAAVWGERALRPLIDAPLAPRTLVNINFPPCGPEEVTGTVAAVQGKRTAEFFSIDARTDGRGNAYFWLMAERASYEVAEGTDLHALRERRIAVTPLKLNLTDMPTATAFARALGG